MEVKPKYYILSKFVMGLMGIFIPVVKEIREMSYQYDRDYIFDSSKFNKRFNFKPTTYAVGIPASLAS